MKHKAALVLLISMSIVFLSCSGGDNLPVLKEVPESAEILLSQGFEGTQASELYSDQWISPDIEGYIVVEFLHLSGSCGNVAIRLTDTGKEVQQLGGVSADLILYMANDAGGRTCQLVFADMEDFGGEVQIYYAPELT